MLKGDVWDIHHLTFFWLGVGRTEVPTAFGKPENPTHGAGGN